jgi:hypothetical protein
MKNIRGDKAIGLQYILLKKKVRKLEKKFARLAEGATLSAERIIKTMTSVQRRIKHIEEVVHAVHK